MDGTYQGRQARFAQTNASPLDNRLTSFLCFKSNDCALTAVKDARSTRGKHNTDDNCLALMILVYEVYPTLFSTT